MKSYYFGLLVSLYLAIVNGLNHIPERARGGDFYTSLVKSTKKDLKASPALTWSAPVDHFDAKNNATFLQR